MTDDTTRSLSALADKIENSLRQANSDNEQASGLTSQLIEDNLRVGIERSGPERGALIVLGRRGDRSTP